MNDTMGGVPPSPNGGKKKRSLLAIGGLGLLGIVVVGFIFIIGSCCCSAFVFQLGANSTSDTYPGVTYSPTSNPVASQPTAGPTVKPTATPKPQSTYEKYKGASPEQIKADATTVTMDQLMRDTDSYKGKLITIKANVVSGSDGDYNVNINPNYVESLGTNTGTKNYAPQFVRIRSSYKVLDGDKIQFWGVPSGETTWIGDYPIIDVVYMVRIG